MMLPFVLLFSAFSGKGLLPAGAFAAGREKGTLRGRVEMNAALSFRLGANVDMIEFLLPGKYPFGLAPLLGETRVTPKGTVYASVRPTSLTMMLWKPIAENLAQALASACAVDPGSRNPLSVSEEALGDLTGLCRSQGEAPSPLALERVWLRLDGFRAPRAAFDAWAAAVVGSEFAVLPPKAYAKEALTALLLDPNVLLVD